MIRYCSTAGCPNEAHYRGKCLICSKEHDRSIDRAGRATYQSKRWRVTRAAKLSATPVCERCGIRLATVVHHDQDIAEGGSEWDMTNLIAMCKPCHDRTTRHRQLMRSKDSVLDSGRGK